MHLHISLVGDLVSVGQEGNHSARSNVFSQVGFNNFVLSCVVSVYGLPVFALELADGTKHVFDLGQVLLNPIFVVLHGQMVTPLS